MLNPKTLSRCIRSKIKERNERCGENQEFNEEITNLLGDLTGELKHEILGQYFENRKQFEKQKNRGLDDATISAKLSAEFDQKWANLNTRLDLISGKRILAELNTFLQKKYKVSVTHRFIAGKFLKSEISDEIVALISQIDSFRSDKVN